MVRPVAAVVKAKSAAMGRVIRPDGRGRRRVRAMARSLCVS